MGFQKLRMELVFDQVSSIEQHPQAGEEATHLTIGQAQVLQTPWLLEPRFLHSVEWEPIQQGRVMHATTYVKELLPKAFVGLLEES